MFIQRTFKKRRTRAVQAALKKGFTLVESLVAISILLVTIVVPMQIATHSVKTTALAKEQLTATFLAQEGIESIIRLRDNEELSGASNWSWIPIECTSAGGCSVNPSNGVIDACPSGGAGCILYLDEDRSTGAYYSQTSTGNIVSPYTRKVTISDPGGAREATITAVVSWYSYAVRDTINITIQNNVFNQYE